MDNISVIEKIEKLLEYYRYSTKLAEALEVSRISIVNWRDGASVSEENRLKIDYLYAEKIAIPQIETSKKEAEDYIKEVTSKDYSPLINSIDLIEEVAKFNSFGSLEVETDIKEKEFKSIIEGDYIEKDTEKRKVILSNNLYHLTKKIIKETAENKITLSVDLIKQWHSLLFIGVREDAGEFSKNLRVIGKSGLQTTHPEDVEEEMEYWINCYKNVSNIYDIAKAHEHFELIHPFGGGNGRIGRLIMAHQSIKLGLLPPYIHKGNKALYYAALYKAQTDGNIMPLSWFIAKAVKETELKITNGLGLKNLHKKKKKKEHRPSPGI